MPELHEYQRRAVKHLLDHNKAGLFMDMGLGKTAVVLTALTDEHLPALVIAPKRVAEHVWRQERDKWRPDLSMALAIGSKPNRVAALSGFNSNTDIVVVGRDNIKDVPESKFETIVLDESSGFKSRSTQRWKTARRLTGPTPYVWELTGTPSPNGLMDLWAQIFLLDRGQRLEDGIGKFRDRYFYPGRRLPNTNIITQWHLKPGAEEAIHRRIEDICLSMFSDDHLDLPAVTYNKVEVPLPGKAMKVYRQMKKDLVADIDLLGTFTAANAAVLSNKLSQISAGFLYDDNDTSIVEPIHDAKIEAIQEIIDGTGSPVLIFHRYIAERDRILAAIPGAESIDSDHAIERWNDGSIPVLLAHPASAGHGLNLQHGGHTIVWATLPWSLEEHLQANGRLARQGQENPVVVHYLLSPGTIDSYILKRLQEKSDVQTALMTHLSE